MNKEGIEQAKEDIKADLDHVLAMRKEVEKAREEYRQARDAYSYEATRFANLDELAAFNEEGKEKLARLKKARHIVAHLEADLEAALEEVKGFLLPQCSVEYTSEDGTRYLVRHQGNEGRKSAIHFNKQEK